MGAQGGQGEPIEWVSTHRYHHLHTDTPLDPHSPYEGFWWSHVTWLANTEASCADYDNANDLKAQLFYRVLEVAFFPWLFIAKPLLTHAYLGGLPAVTWTLAVPMVLGWHSTFLVNSAAHVWGRRPYDTGDLSTNNWVRESGCRARERLGGLTHPSPCAPTLSLTRPPFRTHAHAAPSITIPVGLRRVLWRGLAQQPPRVPLQRAPRPRVVGV